MTELLSIHPNDHLPSTLEQVVVENKRKNTFSWSSSSSAFSNLSRSTSHTTQNDAFSTNNNNNSDLDSAASLTAAEALSRAASHGDILTIKQLLLSSNNCIDIPDEDGTTPLIYAACFGKVEVVKVLLEAGAKLDVQDKIGWTALMWATTNGHDQIVELLLEHSACSETKSLSGKTLFDFVDTDNEKMFNLLTHTSSPEMTCTLMQRRSSSNWRKISLRNSIDGYNIITAGTDDMHDNDNKQKQQQQQEEEEEEKEEKEEEQEGKGNDEDLRQYEASFRSVHKFVWDQCLPDQMFVFAEEEMDSILNVAITELKLPIKTRAEIYVPANIVFLGARYAHYFNNREMLHSLLLDAVQRIKTVVKDNMHDIHTLSFWMTNLSQLLYYLKKDNVLVIATAEHQLEIAELISETYTCLVTDSQIRLEHILEPALLDFEQLDNLETVHFADEWHSRFFFLSSNKNDHHHHHHHHSSLLLSSPQSVSLLLTSTLYVLQSYEVHPVIVIQAIAQLFHFLSCELFNRILNNKRYLCRSKALQIRMNLTVMEEWVRENSLPHALFDYFNQVVQLVQLLQCLSQQSDMIDFVNTIITFDLLNPKQISRVVSNYRYEVNEPKLPDLILQYVSQAADTRKKTNDNNNNNKKSKRRYTSIGSSHPNSISSLGNLISSVAAQQNLRRCSLQPSQTIIVSEEELKLEEEDDEREWLIEQRDSRYMLPFSLPTVHSSVSLQKQSIKNNNNNNNNNSLSESIYLDLKQKMTRERIIRDIVPSIPEDWLERLDNRTKEEKTTITS